MDSDGRGGNLWKYFPTFEAIYQKLIVRRRMGDLTTHKNEAMDGAITALMGSPRREKDVPVVVSELAKQVIDGEREEQLNAAWALTKAARQGMDISGAARALLIALSGPCCTTQQQALSALRYAIRDEKMLDALAAGLSDPDRSVRGFAAGILADDTKNIARVNLDKVRKALHEFVGNEGKKGVAKRRIAEKEAAEHYLRIAKAEGKRRESIGMDGLLLDGKIKAPSGNGNKMFRQQVQRI